MYRCRWLLVVMLGVYGEAVTHEAENSAWRDRARDLGHLAVYGGLGAGGQLFATREWLGAFERQTTPSLVGTHPLATFVAVSLCAQAPLYINTIRLAWPQRRRYRGLCVAAGVAGLVCCALAHGPTRSLMTEACAHMAVRSATAVARLWCRPTPLVVEL